MVGATLRRVNAAGDALVPERRGLPRCAMSEGVADHSPCRLPASARGRFGLWSTWKWDVGSRACRPVVRRLGSNAPGRACGGPDARLPPKGGPMPQYVALIDWTDQGVHNFKDTVDRYESAEKAFQDIGVSFTNIWWTLGAHDIVATIDAPDDETLAAALLAVAGRATSARRRSGRSRARRCALSSPRFPNPGRRTLASRERNSPGRLRRRSRIHGEAALLDRPCWRRRGLAQLEHCASPAPRASDAGR